MYYQQGRHACTHMLCTVETETFVLSDINSALHHRHPRSLFCFRFGSRSRSLVLSLSDRMVYPTLGEKQQPPPPSLTGIRNRAILTLRALVFLSLWLSVPRPVSARTRSRARDYV